MIPEQINNFAKLFSELPSIGPRMAIRLAYTIAGLSEESQDKLTKVIINLKTIDRCQNCLAFKARDKQLCTICSNANRKENQIMIVEKETDQSSIERNQLFTGTYFIFGPLPERGALSEKHEIRIRILKNRITKLKDERAEEVILALPHTKHGMLVTQILKEELKNFSQKITELARGLPTGADIEFADSETLRSALEFRM